MQTAVSKFGAALLAGVIMLTGAVSVQAQGSRTLNPNIDQRDRVIQSYCDSNRNDRDCRGYYGGRWNNNDYNRFYGQRRNNLDALATGLFGFGFGAILGGALANGGGNYNSAPAMGNGNGYSNAHIQACFARYRSYDVGTDSYMGFDGYRHRCNL